MNMGDTNGSSKLSNGETTAARGRDGSDVERLRARVDELEDLCAELYDMGVELGVPHVFLNKLWTVAAHGNEPRAFDAGVDVQIMNAGGGASSKARDVAYDEGVADIRLIQSIAPPTKSAAVPARPLTRVPDRRRVMVVDDDPAVLAMLLKVLAYENYELLSANSGPEALEKLTDPIDLLITDFVMPIMNGRQLAEQVRRRYPYVKVLYETGFSDLLFKGQVEVERNAAFIEKPYSARGLIEAARLALFGYIQPPATEKTA
jgi:CheY-like chemotaxis protein